MYETVLVTGGAGYIGSHVVRALEDQGKRVVIVDDLSTGLIDRVGGSVNELDVSRQESVTRLHGLMASNDVSGIIHFAAKKRVDESITEPLTYWRENVGGLVNVLEAARLAAVNRIVFSSSAAVYGEVTSPSVTESTTTLPMNPYGWSKLAGEKIISDFAHATGARTISLRYFNVAGAASPELADRFPMNLLGAVFSRIEKGEAPLIFGNKYPTPDGTCVRDFIHVEDLANAHIAALQQLGHKRLLPAYNLGTGTGYSVGQVMDRIVAVSRTSLSPRVVAPREGDPAQVIADSSAAQRDLHWCARRSLDSMIQSAWDGWMKR